MKRQITNEAHRHELVLNFHMGCYPGEGGATPIVIEGCATSRSRAPHFIKVTRHLSFKNIKNLQLLDIQACNSVVGRPASLEGVGLLAELKARSQVFAIFEA